MDNEMEGGVDETKKEPTSPIESGEEPEEESEAQQVEESVEEETAQLFDYNVEWDDVRDMDSDRKKTVVKMDSDSTTVSSLVQTFELNNHPYKINWLEINGTRYEYNSAENISNADKITLFLKLFDYDVSEIDVETNLHITQSLYELYTESVTVKELCTQINYMNKQNLQNNRDVRRFFSTDSESGNLIEHDLDSTDIIHYETKFTAHLKIPK